MRREFLPFAAADLDGRELDQVKEALESGWITTGPKVREFEARFAETTGAKHAVAVNSCTAAMHLALEAIGLQPGDEIITTPYTFASTAEVVRYFDARPVFVDVCRNDFNLNPELIEAAITERTRALIPVHIAGLAAEMDDIHRIAERHGLAVIEDAAHAFPATYRGRMVGSASPVDGRPSATCFSFYATKPLTTGEGGMICTDEDAVAERCRIMGLHGMSKDAWKRYMAEDAWYYEIIAPGFKYNMTDIAAAMGLAQLDKAEQMWQRRADVAQCYNESFRDIPGLQIPHDREDCQHAWHLYMLRLNKACLNINRDQFIEELTRRNIGVSVHFIPLHLHPYYRETYGYQPEDYPAAREEYEREISLPIYSRMTDQDVRDVTAAVGEIADLYQK